MNDKTGQPEGESLPLPPDGAERRPRRDFLGALFLVAIAIAFISQALRIPFSHPTWEWYTAPGFFPLGIAVGLLLCSLYIAIRGFKGWKAQKADIAPIRWEDARAWGIGRFAAAVVLIAAMISLLGKVDFYLLAPGSIVVFALIFTSDKRSRTLRSSLIAALFIVVFRYCLTRYFGIVFP